MSQQEDVFVIGGGPAGLEAALALRQKGFGVTVADAARPPIEKVCGEGILPEGAAALRGLDVSLSSDEGLPLRGMHFLHSRGSVQAEFPGADGLGMRRVALHRRLTQAAERAGILLLWHTRVTGLVKNGVPLQGEVRRARWIVGADGCGSPNNAAGQGWIQAIYGANGSLFAVITVARLGQILSRSTKARGASSM